MSNNKMYHMKVILSHVYIQILITTTSNNSNQGEGGNNLIALIVALIQWGKYFDDMEIVSNMLVKVNYFPI